jgi:hypothetical protein
MPSTELSLPKSRCSWGHILDRDPILLAANKHGGRWSARAMAGETETDHPLWSVREGVWLRPRAKYLRGT